MDELKKKIEEIVSKWKSEMSEQNIEDFNKFYRLNYTAICEDMEDFWLDTIWL